MQRAREDYFVRLDVQPTDAPARPRRGSRTPVPSFRHSPDPKPHRRRRRKRANRKALFLVLALVSLGSWALWASEQPGGVSGTVNGFIDHVRGDVQNASAGRSLGPAAKYYNQQYKDTGRYPQLSEEEMTNAGIGLDVDVRVCSNDAVVLQTLAVSRLLLGGRDLGEVSGRVPCPDNLENPSPWHLK